MTADLTCDAGPDALRAVVADLGTYPDWLEIVASADPLPPGQEGSPAWSVVLRAQLGPLRRSKRLRMVRTVDDAQHIRFERRERDGRSHSPWTLDAAIRPDGDGATLTMSLHYGGSLWIPVLDRLLADEIERSRPRLVARLAR